MTSSSLTKLVYIFNVEDLGKIVNIGICHCVRFFLITESLSMNRVCIRIG